MAGTGQVKVTDSRASHHTKQSCSMASTRGGIVTWVSAPQSMKLEEPMNRSVSGSVTAVSAGMLAIAPSSMRAAGAGMSRDATVSFRMNACRSRPNSATPSISPGTATAPPGPS